MITNVVCGSGVVLKCDLSIKPGDVVTGYHKGYWMVDKVIERKGSTPLIHYTRIDKKGSKSCDASYCSKIDPEVLHKEMILEADRVYAMLLRALNK